ncbi:MAG: hypothetical protein HGA96_15840 [Desulfobulbaceae bacterium]|nr:hypothetical protein [Desulfobulbaceae bacterium]
MTPFDADYTLTLPAGAGTESGRCVIAVAGPGLTVTPNGAAAIPTRFAEVVDWQAEDYACELTLADGSVMRIAKLARRYDEFVATFRETRREHFLKALLLEEEIVALFGEGSYELRGPGGESPAAGVCGVYLQKRSLACFPDRALPFLLPYGAVTAIDRSGDRYRLTLTSDDGCELVLHRFGKETDRLCDQVETLRAALARRQGDAIAALSPETSALSLRIAGQLLRDGAPAECRQIEAVAAGVWGALWSNGFNEERRPFANYLLERADNNAFVAIKETGAWGAPENTPAPLVERRMLFFFPIGDKIVVETPSAEDTATFIFRSSGDVAGSIRTLCRALAAVQFRREPLYLPLSTMNVPPHDRYAEACRLLPELVAARKGFVGRAIHASLDSWKQAVEQALTM